LIMDITNIYYRLVYYNDKYAQTFTNNARPRSKESNRRSKEKASCRQDTRSPRCCIQIRERIQSCKRSILLCKWCKTYLEECWRISINLQTNLRVLYTNLLDMSTRKLLTSFILPFLFLETKYMNYFVIMDTTLLYMDSVILL